MNTVNEWSLLCIPKMQTPLKVTWKAIKWWKLLQLLQKSFCQWQNIFPFIQIFILLLDLQSFCVTSTALRFFSFISLYSFHFLQKCFLVCWILFKLIVLWCCHSSTMHINTEVYVLRETQALDYFQSLGIATVERAALPGSSFGSDI